MSRYVHDSVTLEEIVTMDTVLKKNFRTHKVADYVHVQSTTESWRV